MPFLLKVLAYIATNFSIISVFFYFCLALFVIVYYTIGKKFKIQWSLLLIASLFFYLANGRKAAFLIFIPCTITYVASCFVGNSNDKTRKLLTSLIVLFNVVFLVCFKELNFFIHIWNRISSYFNLVILNEVHFKAPFGISYIVLMLISYFLDVNWNMIEHQKNPLKFLTYILFFPITSSGPICRYTNLKDSLFSIHYFDYEKFCFACQRILWGFFKKLVIANKIAIIVSNVYGNNEATGFVVLIGLLSFSLQMYFDFSGCMDMVVGIGALLGIELPENFKQPFYSTNLSEFWRRWHITLGLWVKDYILYPVLKSSLVYNISVFLKSKLGKKNRYAKLIPTWIGMLATWFVVGFWHGGSWNYIFGSGLFFFFMIAGGQLLEPFFTRMISFFHINTESLLWRMFQRIRTALLFAASISFDRANGLRHGVKLWHRVWNHFFSFSIQFSFTIFFILLFSAFILYMENYRESFINKLNPMAYYFINLLFMLLIMLFGEFGNSSFIYFNF